MDRSHVTCINYRDTQHTFYLYVSTLTLPFRNTHTSLRHILFCCSMRHQTFIYSDEVLWSKLHLDCLFLFIRNVRKFFSEIFSNVSNVYVNYVFHLTKLSIPLHPLPFTPYSDRYFFGNSTPPFSVTSLSLSPTFRPTFIPFSSAFQPPYPQLVFVITRGRNAVPTKILPYNFFTRFEFTV